jgi:serine/threonine protein kinase
MDRAEAQLYIGQLVAGRYQIDAFRGSGAFSGVFIARDLLAKKEVAVKFLSLRASLDPTATIEFKDEVLLLRTLSTCSNIVKLLDEGQHTFQVKVTGSSGGSLPIAVPYMVLEPAVACLADLLVRRHELEWRDRLDLYRDIVKGAHQMHIGRIVHRDIKAENVLIFEDPPHARLSDLGRSKDTSLAERLRPEEYLGGRGDPRFSPPEHLWLQGLADPDAHFLEDLFLLGSVLFEIATGLGITALALGNPYAIRARAAALDPAPRRRAFLQSIPDMQDRFEVAYETFAGELPNTIRQGASELLKQLTNPDPERRKLQRPFQKLPLQWNLEWVLRKIDILRLCLAVDAAAARRRRVFVPRRRVRSRR